MKIAARNLSRIAVMAATFARQPKLARMTLERGDAEGSSSVIRTAAAVGLALLVVTVIVAALVGIVNATGAKISSATFP